MYYKESRTFQSARLSLFAKLRQKRASIREKEQQILATNEAAERSSSLQNRVGWGSVSQLPTPEQFAIQPQVPDNE